MTEQKASKGLHRRAPPHPKGGSLVSLGVTGRVGTGVMNVEGAVKPWEVPARC